jgi:hypothetical protein
MQALDDIDVGGGHGVKRARFVFAILKFSLLMGGQRLPQHIRNGLSEFTSIFQRK